MKKFTSYQIIGFEISYDDLNGFKLRNVLENEIDELPERSCTTIFVPYDGNAKEMFLEYDGGSSHELGIEIELCGKCWQCDEEKKAWEEHRRRPSE